MRTSDHRVTCDIVDVNVSPRFREALFRAVGTPTSTHAVPSRDHVPLLQGIAQELKLKQECEGLITHVLTHGTVILCPEQGGKA